MFVHGLTLHTVPKLKNTWTCVYIFQSVILSTLKQRFLFSFLLIDITKEENKVVIP